MRCWGRRPTGTRGCGTCRLGPTCVLLRKQVAQAVVISLSARGILPASGETARPFRYSPGACRAWTPQGQTMVGIWSVLRPGIEPSQTRCPDCRERAPARSRAICSQRLGSRSRASRMIQRRSLRRPRRSTPAAAPSARIVRRRLGLPRTPPGPKAIIGPERWNLWSATCSTGRAGRRARSERPRLNSGLSLLRRDQALATVRPCRCHLQASWRYLPSPGTPTFAVPRSVFAASLDASLACPRDGIERLVDGPQIEPDPRPVSR